MKRLSPFGVLAVVIAAVVSSGIATAATGTYVAFAGRDDAIPKLGVPGIAVRVQASRAEDAASVTEELTRELARQVHTRRLAVDEPGDYELSIKLDPPKVDGTAATVRFEASLESSQGERLWRIEGRSDVDRAPLEVAFFAGIARNVVSALIHDGWVQPRYDPDNPPPAPPRVRSEVGGQ